MTTAGHRIGWIDYANVLAMLLVVLFHIPSAFLQPVRNFEYFVVVIPFFVLSGITFSFYIDKVRTNGWNLLHILKDKFRGMLVPSIVFFLASYVLWLVCGRSLAGDEESVCLPLAEFITGRPATVLSTYWFVFCLMTMQLLCGVLQIVLRGDWLLAVICGLLPIFLLFGGCPDYFQFDRALQFIPFFVIGYFAADKLYLQALCIYVLCCIIQLADILIYGSNAQFILASATGLSVLVLIAQISKCLSLRFGNMQIVSTLRYGALVILASQNLIIGFIRVVTDRVIEPDFIANHYFMKPVVLLAVYALTLPVIYLIRNWFPWILGKSRKT